MVGTSLSTDEIQRLLVEEKICWLATVSPKGQPHAIPINFGFFNDTVFLIQKTENNAFLFRFLSISLSVKAPIAT